MNSTIELQELLKEKAQLTRILQTMGEEEKYLGQRLRIVGEKIVIQELREKIKAKRAVVDQLKSKIRELENKLAEPQRKEPVEVTVKAAPTVIQQP